MSIISRAIKGLRAAWEFTFYDGAAYGSTARRQIYNSYGTDHKKLWSDGDRNTMLSASRKLYANVGSIKGAVNEIASYSVGQGWVPQYRGQDKAWGEQAEAWLWEWLKICDVRGQPFDFANDLYCGSIAMDRDGDFGIIPTYTGKSNYPAVQFVSAHQIGNRNGQSEIKDGTYAGMKMANGVVYNAQGRAVAYQIIGEKPEQDRIIPSQSFVHVFDPAWLDQFRGVPSISHAINDIADIADIRDFEKQGVKAASSVGLIEENETGDNDALNWMNQTGATVDGTTLEKLEGGSIWKFKAGSGCSVKPFESARTHPNVIGFLEYLNRGAFAGMSWPLEFSWDPTKLGGANIRLIVAKANRTILRRQNLLKIPARRIIFHGLTTAMQRGMLPQSNDWWNWDFQMPQRLTVDAGRESQSQRDDYAAGLTTLSELYGQRGLDWQEQLDQYAKEKEYAAKLGLEFEADQKAKDEPAGTEK